MKKDKLDKIIGDIFSEIGEIKHGHCDKGEYRGYWGLLNDNGDLIGFKLTDVFYITEYFPLLDMLENTLDEDSFKYLMNRVGNMLADLYYTKEPVEYKRRIFERFEFTYIKK